MQRERRRDPYPWTWEIPLAIGIGVLLVLTVGVQLGRTLANLVAGAGWTWPAPVGASTAGTGPFPSPLSKAFWSSLPGVFAGDAGAGLSPVPPATELGSQETLWVCLVVTELLLLGGGGWVGARGYRRWGPGRLKGMATTAEAETLLGITRLRKVARHVRPDLQARATAMSAPVHREAAEYDAEGIAAVRQGVSPWVMPSRSAPNREIQR